MQIIQSEDVKPTARTPRAVAKKSTAKPVLVVQPLAAKEAVPFLPPRSSVPAAPPSKIVVSFNVLLLHVVVFCLVLLKGAFFGGVCLYLLVCRLFLQPGPEHAMNNYSPVSPYNVVFPLYFF